jgi:hypothetical protein
VLEVDDVVVVVAVLHDGVGLVSLGFSATTSSFLVVDDDDDDP